jgi:hypothetical protein
MSSELVQSWRNQILERQRADEELKRAILSKIESPANRHADFGSALFDHWQGCETGRARCQRLSVLAALTKKDGRSPT